MKLPAFFSRRSPQDQDGLSEEVNFWRARCLDIEAELKSEKRRNQKREDLLLDKVLISRGHAGIAHKVQSELDFSLPDAQPPPDPAFEKQMEMEKKAFIEDCVAGGMKYDTAQQEWESVQKHRLGFKT